MKKRKKVLVGVVMLLTCGLHTVYGKYLYQESRIDVIHTAEFRNDSEAAAEEEINMEPDKNIFFSDGTIWESEEGIPYEFVSSSNENTSFEDNENVSSED